MTRYRIDVDIRPSADLPGVLSVEACGYISQTKPGGDDTEALCMIFEALSMMLDEPGGSAEQKAEMLAAWKVKAE